MNIKKIFLIFAIFFLTFFTFGLLNAQVVTYVSVGNFNWTVPAGVNKVEVLVVAGGGGGGGNYHGAGGGGGGVLYNNSYFVTPGTNVSIKVGAGGAGGVSGAVGSNGANSSFGSLVAVGGGGGGNYYGNALVGGSGGGGGYNYLPASGISGQGHSGGTGVSGGCYGSGGGGGAGGPGESGTTAAGGRGGPGKGYIISGKITYYGGGGGGGLYSSGVNGAGGAGGGGVGTTGDGGHGLNGTGGGGGGTERNGPTLSGGNGGSGTVIIRYNTTVNQGYVSTIDGKNVSVYISNGTFTVPSDVKEVEVLVVAGGGGGGGSPIAGGGGAGGVVYHRNYSVTPGTNIPIYVGAGGIGGLGSMADPWTGAVGGKGGNSSFGSLVAVGGGGGGRYNGVAATSGGSGGGAGYAGAAGSGTSGQGYSGGSATTSPNYGAGGGGGARAVGVTGTTIKGGDGGIGVKLEDIFSNTSNVIWGSSYNVYLDRNTVTKVSGTSDWDAGAISARSFGGDCFASFRIELVIGVTDATMVGFTSAQTTWSYTDIDYAWYFNGGNLYTYEKGASIGTFTFVTGGITADNFGEMRIEHRQGRILYFYKDVLYRDILATHKGNLSVDVSMHCYGQQNRVTAVEGVPYNYYGGGGGGSIYTFGSTIGFGGLGGGGYGGIGDGTDGATNTGGGGGGSERAGPTGSGGDGGSGVVILKYGPTAKTSTPVISPTAPTTTSDLYCYYNLTGSDGLVIWEVRPTYPAYYNFRSLYCDDTFCFVGALNGYLFKIWKNNGTFLPLNPTFARPNSYDLYSLYCDDSFCFGGHAYGYLSKTWKANGTVVWSTGVRPSTSDIYSLYCDYDFCYGGGGTQNVSKIWKNNGTIIWGVGGLNVVPNPAGNIIDLDCDQTYCYTSHSGGNITKVQKSNGTVIWGVGGSAPLNIGSNAASTINCDLNFCFTGHTGYLSKFWKNNGTIIWAAGSVVPITFATNVYDLECDDNFCFGTHYGLGSFSKTWKTNGTIIFGNETILDGSPYELYCDKEDCYAMTDFYVYKLDKDPKNLNLSGYVKWYKNNALTYTSMTKAGSSALTSGNTSKGEVWKCEVTPSVGYLNGTPINSSSVTIQNSVPTILFIDINPPLIRGENPYITAKAKDPDTSDSFSFTFNWYLNNLSVETDSVSSIPNRGIAKTYLNTSPFSGANINISVSANDGTVSSTTYWFNKIIWNVDTDRVEDDARPNTEVVRAIDCNDTFCFGGGNGGSLSKTWKNNATVLWGTSIKPNSTAAIYDVHCDNNFCYALHYRGAISKTWKNNGTLDWLKVIPGPYPMWSSVNVYDLECDDNFCFITHRHSSSTAQINISKMWKNNGTFIFSSILFSSYDPTSLFCDNTFCYVGNSNGNIYKSWKNNGTSISLARPNTYAVYNLYCDSTFCFGGHNSGYLSKTWKDNGTVVWSTGVRPSSNTITSLFCDDSFCFGGHTSGEHTHTSGHLSKTWKDNGTVVWSTEVRPSGGYDYDIYSLYCDDYFCFGGDYYGFISKVYKNDSLVVPDWMCSPIPNANWIIEDEQICDAVEVNLGSGNIFVNPGGNLTLINSANVSSTGLSIQRQGDSVFVVGKSKLNIFNQTCAGGPNSDDTRCSNIDCTSYYVASGSSCYYATNITTNRCSDYGLCKTSLNCSSQPAGALQIDCSSTSLLGCSGTTAGYCSSVSCPFVYAWNGTDYVFDSEAITAFGLIPENQGKQPSRLPSLASYNGTFKIKVTEELQEESHIDSVELLKVAHSQDVEVYYGYKETSLHGYPKIGGISVPLKLFQYFKKKGDSVTKQFFEREDVSTLFTLYTLKDQIKPTNVIENNQSVKELLEIDGEFWNTDLEGFEFKDEDGDGLLDIENIDEMMRSVEFIYPMEKKDSAKLRLNIKESDYMALSAAITIESTRYHGIYDAKKFLENVPSDSAYKISVWNGKEWVNEITFNLYPREKSDDIVVPLNLKGIETEELRIRVRVSYGLLQLDGAYLDYSDEEPIVIERIPISSAMNDKNEDVTESISSVDDEKIVLERGDYVYLEFKDGNETNGEKTTLFLNMRGYYEAVGISEEDLIQDKDLVERMYNEPGLTKRYWKMRYYDEYISKPL